MLLTLLSILVVTAGRAGLLGLAISLVSTVPERVWYVKTKGYKPWLNPKPQDVKHNDEGGHTIWYNEPELLQVRHRPIAIADAKKQSSSKLPFGEDRLLGKRAFIRGEHWREGDQS